MLNHQGPPLVMETVTGPGTMERIQQTLDLLWQQHPDVSETARLHVELAASEIGANVVKYAAEGQPVSMRMQAEVSAGDIRVCFTDDGHPAPVDLAAVRMPPDLAEQGRGLAMAVAVLDQLSFQRDASVNRWTLVRRLTD